MRITLKALRPAPKHLTVSRWAEEYSVVSAGNAYPGRWRNELVPYFVEVMDAFTEPGVERIVVKSCSQIGKTEVLLRVIGRFAHVDPCPMLLINPTLEMSQDFSKTRLMKFIEDTKVLKPLFYGRGEKLRSRDANQTILSKFYRGGRLALCGANSPASLASRPIRILLCDEVDRYPVGGAGNEGDALSIAEKRTTTYWNRKIGMFSTPTVKGISRIDQLYDGGSRERWSHECPGCGEYHTIEPFEIEEDLMWRCPRCGGLFDEKTIKRSRQKYVAGNPSERECRSFYISGFYSRFVSWSTIMREWSEARGKPLVEATVYNTRFGLSYEVSGDLTVEGGWQLRCERYEDEVPMGVNILTAGVDVQADRLEYEIVGWGAGEECWGIRRGVLHGDPLTTGVWLELDKALDRKYSSCGRQMQVMRTFIDSGYLTSVVYEYCARRRQLGRVAIKGVGSAGKELVYRVEIRKGVPLTLLGVNEGKAEVYSRLQVKEVGAQYCHFGLDDEKMYRGYDRKYFEGLSAERKVMRERGGVRYEQWEPVNRRVRNEPLDCRVYALGAMKSLVGVKRDRVAKVRQVDIWR